ncbi:MAG: DUF3662 domain-containing protein [Acidobacteria bacterium]|nr:DUF3662 domain-containing protein [Acidobacteriota bacterium]
MSILDKVRRWIDGETAELVLEQAARDAQVKPRSKAEAFIVKIAREVESVMQNEMVPLPQGTTIIPSEYAIFLSSDDDKEWQGAKRKGLVQGLYHILAERAKEIAARRNWKLVRSSSSCASTVRSKKVRSVCSIAGKIRAATRREFWSGRREFRR